MCALRLTEKGYRVVVLEMGRRWNPEDFPRTNWNVRKYFWKPSLFLYGFFQMTQLRDLFFLHGAGVGGGSLVYANTLLVPPDEAFRDPRWIGRDWKAELLPHYRTAQRMLGAVETARLVETDHVLREVAEERGYGHTFHPTTVGVFFGEAGKTVPDPYFGGEGPARTGCTFCGGCMVGCRPGAKNTLDKNYLYLAEKRGCVILPESRVIDVRPRSTKGADGYDLVVEHSTGLLHPRRRVSARGVVLAAGAYGTVDLLSQCKESGELGRISDRLGDYVRTNSEALLGVRSRRRDVDYSRGIAISSGAYVDDKTHIEVVRYPKGADALAFLGTILTGGGPPWPRWLRWLGNVILHPLQFLRTIVPFGWAQRTAILLVMQPVDNHIRFRRRRRWWWPWKRVLDTDRGTARPSPVYMPVANQVARRIAEKIDGIPQSGIVEVLGNKATTAHLLGGCPIGLDAQDGVIDPGCRVFGYENLFVVDGSMIPSNLGVNPSLTITAMAELAMAEVPAKGAR